MIMTDYFTRIHQWTLLRRCGKMQFQGKDSVRAAQAVEKKEQLYSGKIEKGKLRQLREAATTSHRHRGLSGVWDI